MSMEKEKVEDDKEDAKEETQKKEDEKEKTEEETQKKEVEEEKINIIFPIYLINNEEGESSIQFNNIEEGNSYNKILKIDNKEYLLFIAWKL